MKKKFKYSSQLHGSKFGGQVNLRQNNLGNFGENNIGIVKNLLNTNKVKSQKTLITQSQGP